MEIPNAQLLSGRTVSHTATPRTLAVQNVSSGVTLAAGEILSGRVAQSTSQLLTVSLVGGGEIQLAGTQQLALGESVVLRVASLTPQAEVTLARAPQGGAIQAADIGLTAGQTTVARVFGQLSGQQAVIDVNGQQITLAVPGDLEAGSLLPVRIDEEGGRVFLTVLGGAAATEVLAQHYLRGQQRPRDALGNLLRAIFANLSSGPEEVTEADGQTQQLRSLLERLQPGEQSPADALKRGLEDGGLLLESKLAKLLREPGSVSVESDLKAMLLQLSQSTQAEGKDSPLTQLIRQALSQIEQLQLTNALNQLSDSALVWQLPGWPGSSPVYVRIEPDDDGHQHDESAGRAWQVLMAVDLDDIGPIRVDARLQSRTLRVLLYAPSDNVAELETSLSELRDELSGDDFDRILLGVQALDRLPDDVEQKIKRTVEAVPDNASNTLDVSG